MFVIILIRNILYLGFLKALPQLQTRRSRKRKRTLPFCCLYFASLPALVVVWPITWPITCLRDVDNYIWVARVFS